MAEYTQGIYIDGIFFDVPMVSIKRSFDVIDKFAERNEDTGDLMREILGVYLNYDMAFGFGDDIDMSMDTYDRLLNKLIEPVEYHDFIMPHQKGTFSFRGYISKVTDEAYKLHDNYSTFQNLTCKFTMKKPFLTP